MRLQAGTIGTYVTRENAEVLLFPSITTCFRGGDMKREKLDNALNGLLPEMSHKNNSEEALECFRKGWEKE